MTEFSAELKRAKLNRSFRRILDLAMISALVLLMAYALIGEAAHEILGCAMFVLMSIHMWLNRAWLRRLGSGTWPAYRVAQTALDFLILACMLVSLASGIVLSKHVFAPLELRGPIAVARLAHMTASYWGFCLMSIHFGIHWQSINGSMRSTTFRRMISATGLAVAMYGAFAFFSRSVYSYLCMLNRFAFFDFEEPLPRFFADYIAIFAFCAAVGSTLMRLLALQWRQRK
jgi:hypothetical protein